MAVLGSSDLSDVETLFELMRRATESNRSKDAKSSCCVQKKKNVPVL